MATTWEADYENKQKEARAIDQLAEHGIAERPTDGQRSVVARSTREDSNDEDFPEDADIDPLVWQRTTNRNDKLTAMRISRYSKLPQLIKNSLTDEDLATTIRLSRMHQSRIFEAGKAPSSTLPEPDYSEEDENEQHRSPISNKSKRKREQDDQDVKAFRKHSKRDERAKEKSFKSSSDGKGKRRATDAFEEENVSRSDSKRTNVIAFNVSEPSLPPGSAAAASGSALLSRRRASRRVVNAAELLQASGERGRPLQNGAALRDALRANSVSNLRMDGQRVARSRPGTNRPKLIARLRIQLWDANDDPIVHGMLPKQAQMMMEATAPETLSAMQEWVQRYGPYEED